MNLPQKSILALSIAVAVTGCGGDSSSSDSATPTSSTPVSSSGVITGFGSIYVNGVRYDTASAQVEFEGEGAKTESDLKLGMRVRVKATRDGEERVATEVTFDKDLKGPVTQVTPDATDPSVGTLVVLGQTVTVDVDTVLDHSVGDVNADGQTDIRDLDDPDRTVVVEVSGFSAEGGLIATRIERVNADDDEYEVKGTVSQLDATAGTFMLDQLIVSYDTADLDADDFPESTLSAGDFVEVEGVLLADGSLDATSIELEDDGLGDDEEREGEFEIEGVLKAVDTTTTPHTITINGTTVEVVDAGVLAGMEGSIVEIEGEFNEDGVLVLDADGVKQEVDDNIVVEDLIETTGESSFTTRLGITVTPTGNSRVEDEAGEEGDRLKPSEFLARLQLGDRIEASGYQAADGSIVWTRVERSSGADQGCSLGGPVEADSIVTSAGTFGLQGVTVDTSAIVDAEAFQGEGISGRDSFFAALTAGSIVEAEAETAADCTAGLLMASEVELDLGEQQEEEASEE